MNLGEAMASPKRLIVFNKPYHITTKIVNKEMWFNPEKAINTKNRKHFRTRMSLKRFMKVKRRSIISFFGNLIGFMKKNYKFEISHFVLMDTHYHLIGVCKSRIYPINRCMQTFNMTVAKWINKKAGRDGSLFAKRYSSNVIFDKDYGKAVIGYIYANPVKAGISLTPESHDCTSYKQYVLGKDKSEIKVYENCKILHEETSSKPDLAKVVKELVEDYIAERLSIKSDTLKKSMRTQVLISRNSFSLLSKRLQNKLKRTTNIDAMITQKE